MKELFLIGLSHKTAPVEWRERLALPEGAFGPFFAGLKSEGFAEAVLLSTCNRVELYAVGEEGAEGRLREGLAGLRKDAALERCLYTLRGAEAIRHLFRVTAGLDSLVVGESEILGQVKRSYEVAGATAFTGKLTNVLFQRALFVGKRARTETAIAEGPTSVPALAASLAQRIFGDLKDNRILVLGAGAMAEAALHALLSQKPAGATVVNRTFERAKALADAVGVKAKPWEELSDALLEADVVLCSTGATEPVLTRDAVAQAMKARKHRPLFFIDIAVPRDVEAAAGMLDGVYLYNIDDLESLVKETLARRTGEIEKAQALADGEAAGFDAWYKAWRAGETAALKHAPRHSPAL
jgi:glutamyl-tRNA reductase